MVEGTAIFYDGLTARRHAVTVTADDHGLSVTEDGVLLARWSYDALRQQDAPAGCLRLSATQAPELARLDITDDGLADKELTGKESTGKELAGEILRRCPQIHKAARAKRAATAQIVGWSMAAAVSLIIAAVYLVPMAADRLTPLVPLSVERWIGDAVDGQVRTLFGAATCSTPAGDAALTILQDRLSAAADLPLPVTIAVLNSPTPNAVTLPGGRIYVLSGLLDRAADSAEVAGVLAHEIGHAAHRDGLRRLLQSSGSSFLIGLLFGDVLGGGAIVMAGQTLVNSAHSRAAETAADDFAADLLIKLGQSPKVLGTVLSRLEENEGRANGKDLAFLRSHPLTEDRMAALSRWQSTPAGKPPLSNAQWQALKTICPQGGT